MALWEEHCSVNDVSLPCGHGANSMLPSVCLAGLLPEGPLPRDSQGVWCSSCKQSQAHGSCKQSQALALSKAPELKRTLGEGFLGTLQSDLVSDL